jgi:hypothetical protein
MTIFRTIIAAFALCAIAACAQATQKPADRAAGREEAAVDKMQLKKQYKGVVMGTDVKGATLILYVDQDNLDSMDEAAEDAMLDRTLSGWKAAWAAAHPRAHAKLRLSLRDYYGKEILSKTTPA